MLILVDSIGRLRSHVDDHGRRFDSFDRSIALIMIDRWLSSFDRLIALIMIDRRELLT